MAFPRRSGVLLHPTSLPGMYGIGDLGDAAYEFVDFLQSAGQSYWQILPLSPTGYGDSPYQALSAFAGNPLLINLDRLVARGHLTAADLAGAPPFPTERVDYGWIIPYRTSLLNRAFERFRQQANDEERAAFERFCREQAGWLEDVALYMALKEHYNLKPWYQWDKSVAFRQADALLHWQNLLAESIESQKYRQWQFYEQWLAVKTYANERGILIIGDIPLYVARDSADVWANTHLFHSDENLNPTIVSGVPPDYFSKTGQLWGHPIYRWDVMKQEGYAWWISRFRAGFTLADVVRIDHFRGFYNYWEVPASHKTAMKGRWRFGPGADLFRAVTNELGDLRSSPRIWATSTSSRAPASMRYKKSSAIRACRCCSLPLAVRRSIPSCRTCSSATVSSIPAHTTTTQRWAGMHRGRKKRKTTLVAIWAAAAWTSPGI